MPYSKENIAIPLSMEDKIILENNAIGYGFDSISAYTLFCALNNGDELKKKLLDHKKEFDDLFEVYFSDNEKIRRAYFFYRSANSEDVVHEKINNKKEDSTPFVNARKTIENLFKTVGLDENEYEDTLNLIDASIINAAKTRGSCSKEYKKRMKDELKGFTGYRIKEIIKNFKIMQSF